MSRLIVSLLYGAVFAGTLWVMDQLWPPDHATRYVAYFIVASTSYFAGSFFGYRFRRPVEEREPG